MNEIELYLIFALATGATATYEVYWSILKKALASGIENEFTNNGVLGGVVFFCIQTLLAPLIIVILVVPPLFHSAYAGMEKEMMKENLDLN